jgi:hypothetical protein
MDDIIKELAGLKLSKSAPEAFIARLFQSRDITHLAHLSTKSYAKHKALNSYYNKLLDFIDGFVEAYQGLYGIVKLEIPASANEEPIKHLEELYKYIDENKKVFTDSALLNQIDEVKTLIQSTLYKLKNLS